MAALSPSLSVGTEDDLPPLEYAAENGLTLKALEIIRRVQEGTVIDLSKAYYGVSGLPLEILPSEDSSVKLRQLAARTAAFFGHTAFVHELLVGIEISPEDQLNLFSLGVSFHHPELVEEAYQHGFSNESIDPIYLSTAVNGLGNPIYEKASKAFKVIECMHAHGLMITPETIDLAVANAHLYGHENLATQLHELLQ
jgi:hypothetical protein